MVKIIFKYGTETWRFNNNFESNRMSMEMDFLRGSARCLRLKTLEIML